MNNIINVESILIVNLTGDFGCSEEKAKQVIQNLTTDYAVKNNLPIDKFYIEYGQEFKTFFEKFYGKTLTLSNKNIEDFWTEMVKNVDSYKRP